MNHIMKEKNSNKINFQKWWSLQQKKSLLRFLTCGNVDDGKSTLIGRLLYEINEVYVDQLLSLNNNLKFDYNQKELIDFSLLVDGLQAEREQGITIDVAYRYFSTNTKKFIIADSPGHKQYTRNMATAASHSDVSVILIDAQKGLTNQTCRHSLISSMLGIKYFIIAINKMDLVNFKENIFQKIKSNFLIFSKNLPVIPKIYFVPISALLGDNIINISNNMPWYTGKTLINTLEGIDIFSGYNEKDLIFPIQYVNRLDKKDRFYCGTLLSGKLFVGKKIKTLFTQSYSKISKIITFDSDLQTVDEYLPISLVLEDDIDLSRGDILIDPSAKFITSRSALLNIIWMSENPLFLNQKYKIKILGKITTIIIKNIFYEINADTLKQNTTSQLSLNSIGLIEIIFEEPIFINSYYLHKYLGGIIFIDILTNMTVGAGMVKKCNYHLASKKNNYYNSFELELNKLICKFFPDWNVKNINN
ncbi:GTP-binding protein [Buchnera aphidicola]|uniref:GTP-binding protein n=1 Tax=Buchnera aphidicola TaxID=9 RepID=UPI003464D6ED